ncbi:hypothetical protein [Sulfurospirillum cavolei]|uniref:hypothetical protein n=1 Tax=Sulfurospirillum cavolei TaxID=366522 RepID=UPI0007649294|nr:hypothetical protein [Sulfurospirillum cavolei]
MRKYNFLGTLVLGTAIACTSLVAEEKTADDLVASMQKEDITYAQLMSGMGMAYESIQNGVISMNKLLVDRGIYFIRTHPAPKQKPWVIMDKEDQEGFKAMLVYYDKKMDEDVAIIEKAAQQKDWIKAYEGAKELGNSCLSCHMASKNNVKYVMK